MSQRLSMRKIREPLRLKYELGRSHREIATSLGIANSTVSDYVRRASAAGFSWPLPEGLTTPRWKRHCSRPRRRLGFPARAGLGTRAPGASAPQGRSSLSSGFSRMLAGVRAYPAAAVRTPPLRSRQATPG